MNVKTLYEINFDLQTLNIIREIHMSQRKDFVADLHTHTNFSDGFLSPNELINKALMNEIDIIAITDHNSVGGVIDALKIIKKVNEDLQKKIYMIPGIEISTAISNKRIHIVGLFINVYSPYLQKCIKKVRNGHFKRANIQLDRLEKIGITIKLHEYRQIVGDRVPNWKTMAEAIVKHGYAGSVEEARRLYTEEGKPAHVDYTEKWSKVHPAEAINAIKKAGGVAFIAHLGDIEKEFGEKDTKKIVSSLIEEGLDGIDISLRNKQHSSPSDNLMSFIDNKSLPVILGSDFHKDENLVMYCLNASSYYHILNKKIQFLIEERHYNEILKSISFEDLRFFPSQIIPNNFLDYESGVRNIFIEQGLLSPFLLLKELIHKEIINSLFWNIGFESMLFAIYTIRGEYYLDEIIRCKNLEQIKEFINDRLQKTKKTRHIESTNTSIKEFLEDNLYIYSPIAFRLCYYDQGYRLKTESLIRLYPTLLENIRETYNILLIKTIGLGVKDIEIYIENKRKLFVSYFSEMGYKNIEIHSRIKSPTSLWDKLKICWFIGYDWKNPEFRNNGKIFLKEIRYIWKGKNSVHIDSKIFGSLFEDIIGFRVIIKDLEVIDEYRRISGIVNVLVDKVYKIESDPRRWHHRRLLIWGHDKYIKNELPIEIQCMNWTDYLLSRAYYWHSKGIYIYRDMYPYKKPNNYDNLVEYLKNSKFEELHNMMFKELKNKNRRKPIEQAKEHQ